MLVNRAYGEASYELQVPNSPETRFHIASVSKPFTAGAILLLSEQRSQPGITSSVEYYPEKDLTVIVLSIVLARFPIAGRRRPCGDCARRKSCVGGRYPSHRSGRRQVATSCWYLPVRPEAFPAECGSAPSNWGGGTKSALIPVAVNEFIDRLFWSRIVFGEIASEFTYSGSYRATRVPAR